MNEWIMLLRVLGAVVVGTAIGMERELRYKEAGVRTHALICSGAAIFVLISQFGFMGNYDASRVASTIVSGIGFLGAGMILHKHVHIQGLTTAAGMWATAAIGMAMGTGLYILAVGGTLMVLFVQLIMFVEWKIFRSKNWRTYRVIYTISDNNYNQLAKALAIRKIIRSTITRDSDGNLTCSALIKADAVLNSAQASDIMLQHPYIYSIELAEDNVLS